MSNETAIVNPLTIAAHAPARTNRDNPSEDGASEETFIVCCCVVIIYSFWPSPRIA
jgi:hypothetical protein